jgi:hypothetical protein
MAIRFEFKSNGQAISKQQRINPVLAPADTTADAVCQLVEGLSG